MQLLIENKFSRESENEFQRDNWTVRLDGDNFEVFSDPSIDRRYYYGPLKDLEDAIIDLFG